MDYVTPASRYCCMNVALNDSNKFAFFHACPTFYLVWAMSAELKRHAGKTKFNP
jgi:hypothetical protein